MKLFISYSSRDGDAVRSFARQLEMAGNQVWLDQDLHGGDAWWQAILHQIREADVFVVALSQHALDSEPCQAELRYAQALGKPVLPVQIGEVDSYRIHAIFATQAIDYRQPTVETGFALTNALNDRLAMTVPLPNPLPEPPPIPYEYLVRLGETIRGAAPISHGDQTGLVNQLRQALQDEHDESVRNDIRGLMHTLRSRPEATHVTVTAINDALSEQARPPGWYSDSSGAQRYWDGYQWTSHTAGGTTSPPVHQASGVGNVAGGATYVPTRPPLIDTSSGASESKTLSIIAFVLTGISLLIPFVGIGGIICAFVALGRKESLGKAAVIVSIAVTVLAWIVWAGIVTSNS